MTQREMVGKTQNVFSIRKNRLIIILGFAIAILNSLLAKINDYLIPTFYADRPAPVDLIHDITPYIQPLEYVSDIALVLMILIFVYYLIKYKDIEGPFHFINIATIYVIRSVLNLVTPLGKPLGNNSSHGILKDYMIQYGMFPSGHIGLTFYLFLAIDSKYKKIKWVMLALFIVELVSMSLSRGHFSIDIFGAMILAYAVHKFYLKYKERLLLEIPK